MVNKGQDEGERERENGQVEKKRKKKRKRERQRTFADHSLPAAPAPLAAAGGSAPPRARQNVKALSPTPAGPARAGPGGSTNPFFSSADLGGAGAGGAEGAAGAQGRGGESCVQVLGVVLGSGAEVGP